MIAPSDETTHSEISELTNVYYLLFDQSIIVAYTRRIIALGYIEGK